MRRRRLHRRQFHHAIAKDRKRCRHIEVVLLRPQQHREQVAIGDADLGTEQEVTLHPIGQIPSGFRITSPAFALSLSLPPAKNGLKLLWISIEMNASASSGWAGPIGTASVRHPDGRSSRE